VSKYWLNPANLYRELHDWLKYARFKKAMFGRNPEEELWVFAQKCDGKPDSYGRCCHFYLTVHPRPKSLPALMVALGLAESNADAGRLIKAKAIEQREWYGNDPWCPINDSVIGYPQWVRRGKKMYGVVTYMLPLKNHTEGLWLELMNESQPSKIMEVRKDG